MIGTRLHEPGAVDRTGVLPRFSPVSKVIGHRVADGGELVFDAERIDEPPPAPSPATGDIPRWPHVFTIGAGVFLVLLGFAVEGWDRWGGWGVGACAIGVGWLRLRRAAA